MKISTKKMAIALAMAGLLSASFSLQAQNNALTATEQMAAQKAAAEKVQMLATESGLGMSNYQPGINLRNPEGAFGLVISESTHLGLTQILELRNWSVLLAPFSIISHVSLSKLQWQILPGVRPYSADEIAIIIKNSPHAVLSFPAFPTKVNMLHNLFMTPSFEASNGLVTTFGSKVTDGERAAVRMMLKKDIPDVMPINRMAAKAYLSQKAGYKEKIITQNIDQQVRSKLPASSGGSLAQVKSVLTSTESREFNQTELWVLKSFKNVITHVSASVKGISMMINLEPSQSATMSAGQYMKDSMAEALQQAPTFFKEVQKILKSANIPYEVNVNVSSASAAMISSKDKANLQQEIKSSFGDKGKVTIQEGLAVQGTTVLDGSAASPEDLENAMDQIGEKSLLIMHASKMSEKTVEKLSGMVVSGGIKRFSTYYDASSDQLTFSPA